MEDLTAKYGREPPATAPSQGSPDAPDSQSQSQSRSEQRLMAAMELLVQELLAAKAQSLQLRQALARLQEASRQVPASGAAYVLLGSFFVNYDTPAIHQQLLTDREHVSQQLELCRRTLKSKHEALRQLSAQSYELLGYYHRPLTLQEEQFLET
eukprot:TRINITY_DN2931_c0_g1_i1.p2 TRINITY_DN2931_c0_g1~~TRINITY_DN2931_c0_g1_i1.p2  ORF type:complete len:154 (+),score=24.27 TRINITY_DN2931_c0_g1_i1:2-463(+)